MMAMDIPHQLRAACDAVRRKDFPLADLIPTLQLAANVIDQLREQLQEGAEERRVLHEELKTMRDIVAGIARTRVVDGKRVPQ